MQKLLKNVSLQGKPAMDDETIFLLNENLVILLGIGLIVVSVPIQSMKFHSKNVKQPQKADIVRRV